MHVIGVPVSCLKLRNTAPTYGQPGRLFFPAASSYSILHNFARVLFFSFFVQFFALRDIADSRLGCLPFFLSRGRLCGAALSSPLWFRWPSPAHRQPNRLSYNLSDTLRVLAVWKTTLPHAEVANFSALLIPYQQFVHNTNEFVSTMNNCHQLS